MYSVMTIMQYPDERQDRIQIKVADTLNTANKYIDTQYIDTLKSITLSNSNKSLIRASIHHAGRINGANNYCSKANIEYEEFEDNETKNWKIEYYVYNSDKIEGEIKNGF